ncbi:MAG: DUF1292 domain-containing protein [Lachnospira sp.]|jgi:uncharacterized protein YrzB (UPF0473 family)|uniref:DUF1292 domain-containing protein n=2 Tax=Lachnospiraceae TaxID=186803 RepID=A0ABV1H2N7_9FIRM
MEKNMEKLTFVTEDQESVDFYIIEETRVNGINYLLVTESEDEEDEEAEAYILKDTSKAEDTEAVYEFVESEEELDAVSRIFAELLEDMDLE